MKTLLISVIVILVNSLTFSQTGNFYVKNVSVGIMTSVVATTTLSSSKEKPFNTGYSVSPSLNMLTSRTHNHIMYDCGSNSIQTLNGYLLPNSIDVYVFYSKSIESRNQYLSVGIEKVFPISNGLILALWSEVGSNLKGIRSLSLGITIHPQISLWSKK